jgi:hypothetical protein
MLGGGPIDVEAMRQFWNAALNRVKAYAEAAEGCPPGLNCRAGQKKCPLPGMSNVVRYTFATREETHNE